MKSGTYYSTKDLALASLLYTCNRKLLQLENDSGKFWFVFEDKHSCEKLASSFWRKEAVVNAKEFCDSMRSLKSLIFNKKSKMKRDNEDGTQADN